MIRSITSIVVAVLAVAVLSPFIVAAGILTGLGVAAVGLVAVPCFIFMGLVCPDDPTSLTITNTVAAGDRLAQEIVSGSGEDAVLRVIRRNCGAVKDSLGMTDKPNTRDDLQ